MKYKYKYNHSKLIQTAQGDRNSETETTPVVTGLNISAHTTHWHHMTRVVIAEHLEVKGQSSQNIHHHATNE